MFPAMIRAPLLAAALLAAAPVHAHEPESEPLFPSEEQLEQLGRLAENWMRDFADEVSPMMERLKGLIDDASSYEPPEVLPNGDIIIRRRPSAEPEETPDDDGIAL